MFLRWAEKELASQEAVGQTWQECAGAALLPELNLWTPGVQMGCVDCVQ